MALNVVLHEPQIPQNTGNIARTCAAVGASLHLIRPLGFETSSRYLKRAGLDYWNLLTIIYYDSLEEFHIRHQNEQIYYLSTKGGERYDMVSYGRDCYLVFGKETAGLPETLLMSNVGRCVRIPMRKAARSLNLSNAVAIVVYEALRQEGYPGLLTRGKLA